MTREPAPEAERFAAAIAWLRAEAERETEPERKAELEARAKAIEELAEREPG